MTEQQTLEQSLTAWYTDEARGTHLDFDDLPSPVKRIEAHYASVQPPTRKQIAVVQAAVEAIARCPILSAQSGEPPEITYDVRVLSERIKAARTAVLALFPQPGPMKECGVCGRTYPTSDARDTCPVCWPGFGEYGQQPTPSVDERCTGGDDCTASAHVHGCFADCGACSHPDEHEPVSIADMAPGTTACADPNVNRWYCQRRSDGTCPLPKCIDPSTIRDVTPPTATQEAGDRE